MFSVNILSFQVWIWLTSIFPIRIDIQTCNFLSSASIYPWKGWSLQIWLPLSWLSIKTKTPIRTIRIASLHIILTILLIGDVSVWFASQWCNNSTQAKEKTSKTFDIILSPTVTHTHSVIALVAFLTTCFFLAPKGIISASPIYHWHDIWLRIFVQLLQTSQIDRTSIALSNRLVFAQRWSLGKSIPLQKQALLSYFRNNFLFTEFFKDIWHISLYIGAV